MKENSDNYILVSLDDEKSKSISEVIGSKTCKKIINYLSENKEASQKDLSEALKIPMNTMDYNMKKLIDSGFVQKRKNFFWSKKGKKIVMYELSKKSVIISHKKSTSEKIKSILPAFILTVAGTFSLWVYQKINSVPGNQVNLASDSVEKIAYATSGYASDTGISPEVLISNSSGSPIWAWFLFGAIIAILVISIVNWRKL